MDGCWQVSNLRVKRLDLAPGRESSEPVGLPQCQQALGLVGPGMHGLGRLGLAEVDPVLVAERADLGALRRVGGPRGFGQGRIQAFGQWVLHAGWRTGRLRLPERTLGGLRSGQQLTEVGSQRDVGQVTGFGSGADLDATFFHAA